MKGQNFASQVLSRHTFRISRKKGSDFFDHRGTLIVSQLFPISVATCMSGKSWLTLLGVGHLSSYGCSLESAKHFRRHSCSWLQGHLLVSCSKLLFSVVHTVPEKFENTALLL